MPANSKPNSRYGPGRLGFLDWTRGMAVLSMLNGHVFHSFTRNDLRNDGPYILTQFIGGVGPAVFLFLTGITLAFLIDKRGRTGMGPVGRWGAALRRSLYLWMLAFLFRAQLWLFGYPWSDWYYLFKVDVLNLMGFAIFVFSFSALFTTADRVKIGAIMGTAIALLSPVISMLDWSWLPPQISAYIVPSYDYFAFFPWAAYIAFGLSAGSILRLTPGEQLNRVMQWSMLAGIALVMGGQYFAQVPWTLYPKAPEFWLNGPSLVAIKMGALLMILAAAYLWHEHGLRGKWSIARQMGTTSLVVYWVHIELVYGRTAAMLKESLNAAQCTLCAALLIALMLGLSLLRTHWGEAMRLWRIRFPRLAPAWTSALEPQRQSGD
ncbi:MAG TPA: heparan-alpha-glucosaminide N-acetyltransferase domain-containing protein [Bryobacteraceae bacterium]|nr:heparan-alpha-glucosaminide N-acetyltransferase domain-containing protein [Bryobacteraceae bacterium]